MQKTQAVILLAGRGERLRPLTTLTPKPLLPLAGRPILGWALRALEHCGIRNATLVTGYRGRQVEQYARGEFGHLRVQFTRNPLYATTNTMYSLWKALGVAGGEPFVLIDGDLVFDPALLERFLTTRGNAVLCDARSRLDAEAVKAFGDGSQRVLRIGKTVEGVAVPLGESIGMAKFDAKTSQRLHAVCGGLLKSGGMRDYYEAAFQKMMDDGIVFHAVDVQGAKWVEIDTKSDLNRARELFGAFARHAESRNPRP
ncbi:MAG: NTP transferase domain-containing protein [Terriglobales bacterium]